MGGESEDSDRTVYRKEIQMTGRESATPKPLLAEQMLDNCSSDRLECCWIYSSGTASTRAIEFSSMGDALGSRQHRDREPAVPFNRSRDVVGHAAIEREVRVVGGRRALM